MNESFCCSISLSAFDVVHVPKFVPSSRFVVIFHCSFYLHFAVNIYCVENLFIYLHLVAYLFSFFKDLLTVFLGGLFLGCLFGSNNQFSFSFINTCCLDYCHFIVSLEVRQCQSSNFSLSIVLTWVF